MEMHIRTREDNLDRATQTRAAAPSGDTTQTIAGALSDASASAIDDNDDNGAAPTTPPAAPSPWTTDSQQRGSPPSSSITAAVVPDLDVDGHRSASAVGLR